MTGTLLKVKETVGRPRTGLIDRIAETIPDAWFGGGQYEDFPFPPYGTGDDLPFEGAIGMTPVAYDPYAAAGSLVSRAEDLQVLALQGDFALHARALRRCGVEIVEVRSIQQALDAVLNVQRELPQGRKVA